MRAPKLLLLFIITAMLTLSAGKAQAATAEEPYTMLKQVGEQLFVDIGNIDADDQQKKAQLRNLVKAQLIPHIDTKFVSFKLLGKHVREINKQQALTFINAIESYLTNTYANALMSYKGQEVHFIKPNAAPSNGYTAVKTEIVEAGKPTIDIVFKLRQDKAGSWRVYDLVAEGISLLDAKQKEIIARITEVGIDQVNQELLAKG
ncbi:MlaC/ttg2D family ABC transporter substrate-binding protein [Pseudoalteromonas sp. T1lg48]|uniref:MlaC/ttg2D family ABC transporter substrate-binding protein n=1 Tax=Pseudoalteromonas sp. T1lg48 TaxID=2077100 RepID=UPI000CF70717|nr:ABC transporter substrate-binding protein [Pseudoalteromonas sp. T1lg48]